MTDRTYWQEPPAQAESGSEHQIQARWVKSARQLLPLCTIAAIPNGTNITSKAGRGRAKAEGLLAGYPDVLVTWAGPVAAYIEFKKRDKYPEPHQREILNELAGQGFPVAVVRSSKGAFDFLKLQGAPFAGDWQL